jgi:SNF2 family DNA or RNA helicase
VLSGTPLENKLEDLVSLFQFIKPGLLQESDAFRPQYVKAKIAPHALRRRKSEHATELNLPDKRHDVRWLELLPKQREAYERTESYGVKRISEHGEPVSLTHVLALITQLKLICN